VNRCLPVSAGIGLAVLVLVTACGTATAPDQPPDTTPPATFEHVHGLAVNPADGVLFAATHFGVFRIVDGQATQVAQRWQDTMAFTVAGPDNFLASGHPDLRENLPSHLGLIESTDAAESWKGLSLSGDADFHALELAGKNIFGFDALSGLLMVTSDRQTWKDIAVTAVIDLAWLGKDADAVWATTSSGLTKYRTDGSESEMAGEPPVVLIDSPAPGQLVGVTATGDVYVTKDPERGIWRRTAQPTPGTPEAFEATTEGWYVATERGISRSIDQGATWNSYFAAETIPE